MISKDLYIKDILNLKYILGRNMEVSITKISKNGQVVIPSEIRKEAKIKPFTKFLVFNDKKGNIFLKRIKRDRLLEDVMEAEEQGQ
tara:strand:+ start:1022 stop:1279 length:258 start_codon:yes stop_codon:yes gene_type:complete